MIVESMSDLAWSLLDQYEQAILLAIDDHERGRFGRGELDIRIAAQRLLRRYAEKRLPLEEPPMMRMLTRDA